LRNNEGWQFRLASGRVILDTSSPTFLTKSSIRSQSVNIPPSSWVNNWISYPEVFDTVPILARFSNI
jgi:hypothetical protein